MKHIKTLYDWRDVKGYEGLYQVNQFGWVRNAVTKRRLKGTDMNGYIRVGLFKNKKQQKALVHRIVAEAFIPNPDNYDTVDHLDFNRANNNVLNLRWLPRKENNARLQKNIKRGELQ